MTRGLVGRKMIGPYGVFDVKHVTMLERLFDNDPSYADDHPVVCLYPGESPHDLVTGCHRLLAAYNLGWKSYPAYMVHTTPEERDELIGLRG